MILIRKQCQAALDNAGLESLHVEIGYAYNNWHGARDPKQLIITTECGKPITAIKGIDIPNRVKFSTAEREYVAELFEAFLVKYVASLKKLIKMKHELNELMKNTSRPYYFVCNGQKNALTNITSTQIKINPGKYKSTIKARYRQDDYTCIHIYDALSVPEIDFELNPNKSFSRDKLELTARLHAIQSFQVDNEMFKAAKAILSKYAVSMNKRDELKNKIKDLQSELETCQI